MKKQWQAGGGGNIKCLRLLAVLESEVTTHQAQETADILLQWLWDHVEKADTTHTGTSLYFWTKIHNNGTFTKTSAQYIYLFTRLRE